jgi:3'-5' exoribonuclease
MNTVSTDRLRSLIDSIHSQPLRETCRTLLTDTAFLKAPASVRFHHAYTGGLVAHTVEVAETALAIALSVNTLTHPTPNEDILLTAVLWHDYCKIYEYTEVNGDWIYSTGSYRDRIGHITGSVIAFLVRAEAGCNNIPQPTLDAITHAMLAHHGPVREWGSPVAPQTIEALILHQADMLSANFGATK